jgi:DNA-directed RNA polymerase subunit RPC12/RpoP
MDKDIVEVKNGEWIFTDSWNYNSLPVYRCSACYKKVADDEIYRHKYCLHCGAKMKEMKEDG